MAFVLFSIDRQRIVLQRFRDFHGLQGSRNRTSASTEQVLTPTTKRSFRRETNY